MPVFRPCPVLEWLQVTGLDDTLSGLDFWTWTSLLRWPGLSGISALKRNYGRILVATQNTRVTSSQGRQEVPNSIIPGYYYCLTLFFIII